MQTLKSLKRVTVWYGKLGIIGPFFFENEQGEAVTINVIVTVRYRALLKDIGNIWFQQDGAKCRTVEATLDVLRPVFEDRIISRRADFVWSPRSCDFDTIRGLLFVGCRQR